MTDSKKKIGGFAGKFLPPHIGHVSQIEQSADYCDELVIVVADNTNNSKKLCEEAGLPHITAQMRVEWLKKHFENNPKISVIYMNEDKLVAFPNGLAEWSAAFKQLTGGRINVKFADETYRELNEKYFPECEFVCFDRTKINISASMIRSEPEKFLECIIPEARPFFENYLKNKNNV